MAEVKELKTLAQIPEPFLLRAEEICSEFEDLAKELRIILETTD